MANHLAPGKISTLGQQFMPITQLQQMPANDFQRDQMSPYEQSTATTLGEKLDINVGDLNRQQYQHWPFDWNRLSKDIATEGQRQPFHIGPGYHHIEGRAAGPIMPGDRLLGGHHRAVVAQEQGHMFVPVTREHIPSSAHGGGKGGTYKTVQSSLPEPTWGPLIREHSAESDRAAASRGVAPQQIPGQGQLFTDRRKKTPHDILV